MVACRPGADGSPFQPGRLLVTLRNLGLVALIDLAEGRCVGTFGRGLLVAPHGAALLASGTLLVLDGEDGPGGARVLEPDPTSGRVVWEYRGARPEEFRARGRGTVQGLAEGNVLVANPEAAESFEITRAGEIVWRFRSARLHPADNSTVVSAQRCTPEQLARLSAVPAGPR
ncbi:MAG TPA: hypothetical protein VF530_22410 [Planctomycetota bacterium]